MARPLRIERAGAWYHVGGRGLERRPIFRDNQDRHHWLELLGEAAERWRLVIYAYVLMDNHHHLMLQTREANLGRAMHWFNTSYTLWFNRRHERVGPLFQGRYKAIVVDPLTWGLELSRYLHLNPIRIGKYGLDKRARQLDRHGIGAAPAGPQVQARIQALRAYPWSSYRAYLGMVTAPRWLDMQGLLNLGGRGSRKEQQAQYRKYVEDAVRQGLGASPWEELRGQLVLGSQQMWEQLKKQIRGQRREQPQMRMLESRPSLEQIVLVVAKLKGEPWSEFRDRHGDWGRDAVFYLGRRVAALSLAQLAAAAGGIDYAAVSAAAQRMTRRLQTDRRLAAILKQAQTQLLNIET
jgi:REP element-mobilizing transposase RayT